MMNRLLANKHTSAAAAAYVLAKLGVQLGAIWFPQFKAQFESTAGLIESAAVGYGFLMAGDAKQSAPAEPGEPTAAKPAPPIEPPKG